MCTSNLRIIRSYILCMLTVNAYDMKLLIHCNQRFMVIHRMIQQKMPDFLTECFIRNTAFPDAMTCRVDLEYHIICTVRHLPVCRIISVYIFFLFKHQHICLPAFLLYILLYSFAKMINRHITDFGKCQYQHSFHLVSPSHFQSQCKSSSTSFYITIKATFAKQNAAP